MICQASSFLAAENLLQCGALPQASLLDAPERAQGLRISPPAPAPMPTSTRKPDLLAEVLELALEHQEPARLAPLLAGLMALLVRELLIIAIDEELEGAGHQMPIK